MKAILPIETGDGVFFAHYSEKGLAHLEFPSRKKAKETLPEDRELRSQISRWHKLTTRALKEVLAGTTISELPPFDLSDATDFQRKVWTALQKIPLGKTKTYGEMARDFGMPKAPRAVGTGCGANPIPVLIPCHRLVAANKKLGGFIAGPAWKEKLLEREGIHVHSGKIVES